MISTTTQLGKTHWLDITGAAKHACLHGRVWMTLRLWEMIAGKGCPFDAKDYRLRELSWGLKFASAGMSMALRIKLPGLQIIQYGMVYDPPSSLKKVAAKIYHNQKGQPVILLEACEA
jgi:hypothetical protein